MSGLSLSRESYFKLLGEIADYYKSVEEHILDLARVKPHLWFNVNCFPWPRIFTPIEALAWDILRSRNFCVYYPQYPACGFQIDFANPYFKIGIELDGKEFHDKEKDKRRDQVLIDEGWKIFRITGSEMYCDEYDVSNIGTFGDLDWEDEELYGLWLENTGEGVIESIRQFYSLPDNKKRFQLMHLYVRSLRKHTYNQIP